MARLDADLSQAEADNTEFEYECFGKFRTAVVGVRYYNGIANKNEMVLLIREPENQYDRWAIRVDNVRGEKIGHIKREQACHLSPLLDQKHCRIEGLVQGEKGAYTMPIDIFVFGPAASKPVVENRLRMGYMPLSWVDPADPTGEGAGAGSSAGGPLRLTQRDMDNTLDRMFDEMVASSAPQEAMEPAPEVLSQLFPHQKIGLAWMVRRENSGSLLPFWEPQMQGNTLTYLDTLSNHMQQERPEPVRGGILADDMGLGKTLQVISLIATNRPGQQLPPVQMLTLNGTQAEEAAGPANKRRKTGPNSSMVAQMQQATQSKKAQQAATLAAAAEIPPLPPAAGGPKATLIVCPLSVLSNWATQVEEHTAGNLKVYQYHGPDRNRSPAFLADQDIVVTTYSTLSQEDAGRGLMAVQWLRVVLDEAHAIKNPNSQQTRACMALTAERRWAVTGTPIQNRLSDLYSLMTFLRVKPMDNHIIFVQAVERPVKKGDPRGIKKLQVVLSALAMRRTKDMQVNGRPLVTLPSKTVHILPVQLSREDEDAYKRLELEIQREVKSLMDSNLLLKEYTQVLECILRLRQVCCASCLVPPERLKGPQASAPTNVSTDELSALLGRLACAGDEECAVCLSPMVNPCITRCAHIFCRVCIESVLARQKGACPLCRHELSARDLIDPPPAAKDEQSGNVAVQDPLKASAKVSALITRLLANRTAAPAGQPLVKSVVFSQFVGMMNLVDMALKGAGISFCRLDGSTPGKARAEMLKAFASKEPGSPEVFLVSLKAGGVGMNLTSACQVHMLDPWWNPAVEEQAQDRVHRLGQTREVSVFRYIAEGTIEERMLELQESKRQLSQAAFSKRSAEEDRQTRLNDVKLLMSIR